MGETTAGPLVVGLDLSLTGTGLADSTGHVHRYGTQPEKHADWHQRHWRIHAMVEEITAWPYAWASPDLVTIEGPSYNSSAQAGLWDRAGLFWGVYGQLEARGTPVVIVPPANRAVYATGKHPAGKAAIVEAVTRRWGHIWPALGSDDVADACVLVAMGRHALGAPLTPMPQTHARALAGVAGWPTIGWETWTPGQLELGSVTP